jgi:ABC-2 type transport system permease protein
MKGILAIEWLKMKHYRTFWVLAGLFSALLLLWNILISQGILKLGGGGNINFMNITYSFPSVWDNIGYWTKFFSGLLAIVIIILVTNEYQFRTNRQNVIDGWTRLQFFHAKWLVVICMSVTITLYVFLQGIAFGLANGSSISEAGGHIEKLLYVLVLTMNYFAFAMTLSFMLKRSGMTIVIFLLYTYIIEIIIGQLLNWKIDGKPGNYLPLQCSAELLNFPLMTTLQGMMTKAGPSNNVLVITSLVWIVIYYLIGRRQLLRNDW